MNRILRPLRREEYPGWYEMLGGMFPPNERKPLSDVLNLADAGRYEVQGLFEGEALLGFASLWSHPDCPGYLVLDYLGVCAQRRCGGLGAEILGALRERFAGRALLITEAESPVPGDASGNPMRARRIAFYERCGFVQVYDIASCGARFRALVLGEIGDMDALMRAHKAIYGPARTDVVVPLGPDGVPRPSYWMEENR